MYRLKRSFIAAAALAVLFAVVAILVPPSILGQITEKVKFGFNQIFAASVESQPAPATLVPNDSGPFHFLPPLALNAGHPGAFDPSVLRYLRVEICKVDGGACPAVKTFTAKGTGAERLRVAGNHYIVNWNLQSSNVTHGAVYRVSVVAGNFRLGAIDLTAGVDIHPNQTLPIKFWVEKAPELRVRILRSLGNPCSKVASVLKNEFGLSAGDTALLLANDPLPCSAAEVDLALRGVYQDAVVPDTTKVSDDATRDALTLYDPSTGRMTFSAETPLLRSLNIGDVLVSEPSEAAPYGYLRKITTIRKGGGQIVLETVQAKLNEALSRGALDASGEVLPNDAPASGVAAWSKSVSGGKSVPVSGVVIDEGEGFTHNVVINETIHIVH